MCSPAKKLTLIVVILIMLLIVFGRSMDTEVVAKSERFDDPTTVITVNGTKVPVRRDSMGWLTSGADLRDQVAFSSTNQ